MNTTDYSPAKPRIGRRRRQATVSSPTPTALTLVAATYAPSSSVTLTFSRAIDVSGIVGGAIQVNDGDDGRAIYAATGTITTLSPSSVRIGLNYVGESEEAGVTLDATAGNGIVAADDGAKWAGATNLNLPFP